eukprot:scaffold1697_cov120-Cylindrotheca_fusiformis.AAC.41
MMHFGLRTVLLSVRLFRIVGQYLFHRPQQSCSRERKAAVPWFLNEQGPVLPQINSLPSRASALKSSKSRSSHFLPHLDINSVLSPTIDKSV